MKISLTILASKIMIDLSTAETIFQRMINDVDSIKQKREYILDIIKCAEANSAMSLVFHWEVHFILMQKAFTPRLKRLAAAKNFTLDFVLNRQVKLTK